VNAYQRRKARAIVALLKRCGERSTLTRHQLAQAVSLMSFEQWRTVAFTAGVPLVDLPAKTLVLRALRGRA